MFKYVKIISFILVFSIVFSCFGFSAYASSSNASEDYHSSINSFWDYLFTALSCAADITASSSILPLSAGAFEIAGVFFDSVSPNRCPVSSDGLHHGHLITPVTVGTSDYGKCVLCSCDYCSNNFWCYSSDLVAAYDDYVESLDSNLASTTISLSGFTCTSAYYISSSFNPDVFIALDVLGRGYPSELLSTLHSLGIKDKVLICGIAKSSPYYLEGVYFDSDGSFTSGYFTNPLGAVNASLFGVYSFSDLDLIGFKPIRCYYYMSSSTSGYYPIYYSKAYASQSSDFLLSDIVAFDWTVNPKSGNYGTSSGVANFYFSYKLSTSTDFTSSLWAPVYASDFYYSTGGYRPDTSTISWNTGLRIVAPSGTDANTRVASTMQIINNYNVDNSYTDNSTTINYYIGTVDDSNNVTNIYSPNIFDEQTMVFTEPVSGTQYTCSGWKYYYDQRAYVLELADNSMSYDGQDVKYLVIQYGDDDVTIAGYSAESEPGDLDFVFLDSYAYVLVSQSECAINGHVYNYEIVREPTCTTPGERKYTCTVCGDEYAEDIPVTGHSYEYSIYREPTCLETGIGLYTCSTCGDQYTELIPASGHSLEMIEYVPTEYDDEGRITSVGYTMYRCTVCGTEVVENDDVGIDADSFWDRLRKTFTNTLANLIEKILDFITNILEMVLDLIYDLLSFFFSFLSSTVIAGIGGFFSAFTDGSLFGFFQQENEDGTAIALPEGVGGVFAFFSGVILALPWELRSLLIFGIAALVLLAVLKMAKS